LAEKTPNYFRLTCSTCCGQFESERSGPGRLPRFCSITCRRERQKMQNAQYRTKRSSPRPAPKPIHRRVCIRGSEPFATSNLKTVTCGRACGNAWHIRPGRPHHSRGDLEFVSTAPASSSKDRVAPASAPRANSSGSALATVARHRCRRRRDICQPKFRSCHE